ncbi:MAG: TerB family tellurite resistance protein [Acidobacteriota bacterium]|nr:TerB family tellurite resistance protein [Acidobacteriota bacterium]
MSLLQTLRQLLGAEAGSPDPTDAADPVQLATAALFLQVMHSDFHADDTEHRAARASLQEILGLSPEETDELLDLAASQAEESVSLYEFTRPIHRNLTPEQKLEVTEGLWRVVFADGHLAAGENHIMRKIKGLLHVPQKDYIAAKQRARARIVQAQNEDAAEEDREERS